MTDLTHAPAAPDTSPLELCRRCESPLAPDQRWCLRCGQRRSSVASPFAAQHPLAPPAAAVVAPALAPAVADRWPRWLQAVLGVATAAVLFAAGLAAGLSGHDRTTQISVPTAPAPVVNVTVPAGGGGAATDTASAFSSDWPGGKDGWTVQLDKLPTDGTDAAAVAAAKTAVEGKGASDVGALLSDDYATLPSSRYIVYSGVYATKAKAAAALKGLKRDFPKAKVIQVSETGGDDAPIAKAPTNTKDLSPDEFQKQSKKLPDKVGTEGTPPPTDSKPAGGGTQGTEIG